MTPCGTRSVENKTINLIKQVSLISHYPPINRQSELLGECRRQSFRTGADWNVAHTNIYMPRARKPRQRIPKEDRRNLRLWAEGAREEVLIPHLDGYSQARDMGWIAERVFLQKVCNEFHARVDWRIRDGKEPVLKPYDAAAHRVAEVLTPEEEEERGARQDVIDVVSDRL